MNAYLANFELGSSTDKCEIVFAGAFVAVAVIAPDIRNALDRAENALIDDGYQIRLIEGIQIYDSDEEWDDEFEYIISEALKTGQVVYGKFHCYADSEFH